jgi:peptide chain release factor subunit 1
MADVLTWEMLRELADVRDEQGCALSLYVDLDPSSTPTPADVETRVNSLVSELEKTYLAEEEDGPRTRAIRANLDRLLQFLTEFNRDGTRGLAVLVSSEQRFFRGVGLPERVPDHVQVDSQLSLAPLVPHVGGSEGALVAMIDRERGQVFRLRGGRLEEIVDETEDQPGQHSQGGWSQARYQRHIEHLVRRT